MRAISSFVAVAGALAASTNAAVVKRTEITSTVAARATAVSTRDQPSGCAAVSATLGTTGTSSTFILASDALDCLHSVPLDSKRALDFLEFIEPFLQYQSTVAYLKDPPIGWTLPGVDLLGGLSEIEDMINNGTYTSQWEFEVDLYSLVNIFPHDFHLNLQMPLLGVFNFQTVQGSLVSVSEDGLQIPEIYFKNDLDLYYNAEEKLPWTPSALVSIEGVDIATFLNYMGQVTSDFQDPDAIFNQMLSSVAFNYLDLGYFMYGNLFVTGGHIYGFRTNTWTYEFANGTTQEFQNVATTTQNFSEVQTGQDLFNLVDLPPSSTSSAASATTSAPGDDSGKLSPLVARATSSSSTITSLVGYPTPVAIHPDGYTSGYFLPNSSVAVLAMQGFIDAGESDGEAPVYQQAVIKDFLGQARAAGMTKLIIDLQGNGGGDIFSGFDAFKQLFPTLDPFGASRLRATPAANYLGEVFSAQGIYNASFSTVYQFQSSLDANNHAFQNWNVEDGPVSIYGDNFTQELRYNFSDVITESGSGGINITGYLGSANAPPQSFHSHNIVMLYDGSCGSTCAVFSELMKAQGGVRSIAVGGRPQAGPMQGVAGSKGAQVYSYNDIAQINSYVPSALEDIIAGGDTPPTPPAKKWILDPNGDFPLGDPDTMGSNTRFNLRNNMHDGDATYTPLQFQYEATNCKLFYTALDQYDISSLWGRVADVVWGSGKCVAGSSVNADDSFPANAYDTVPFGASAYSSVIQAYQPGLLAQKTDC